MKEFTYHNPTKVIFGPGVVRQVGVEAAAIGKRALVVTGKGHAERSGQLARVRGLLDGEGVGVEYLKGIDPNPRIRSAREGAAICRDRKIDLVIALGGGSVMDISKVIAAAALYEGDAWDLTRPRQKTCAPPTASLPTMMIPTLAATGSEMNPNAVVTNLDTMEKVPVSNPLLYPRVSIIDPELTCSVPRDHTAYGIVDTITHTMESYVNGADDTPLQDQLQEGLIRTVMEWGPKALADGKDIRARTHLQWASVIALNGWTHIGCSPPGFPMHMIEHAVSAHYDIAHGAGLAAIMPAFMKMACKTRLDKYVQFADRILGIEVGDEGLADVAAEGIEQFETYIRSLGLPTRLSGVGIGTEKFDRIAGDVLRTAAGPDGLLPGRPPLDREGIKVVLELAK